MSDLVARLRANVTYTYMPMAIRQQLAEAADLIESLSAEVAAAEVEQEALRRALASLLNNMTGAFSRIEVVAGAVAKDMRRSARDALSGRMLAGEGCDG